MLLSTHGVSFSGKMKYTEGWVEFKKKRIAKAVVEALNGNIIGGRKRSFYHDDIWTMRYLPRFKWANLTEKLAYDSAVRKKRLQRELSQVKKETDFYIEQIDKNKQLNAIKRKRTEKLVDTACATASEKSNKELKQPKQRKVVAETSSELSADLLLNVFTQ